MKHASRETRHGLIAEFGSAQELIDAAAAAHAAGYRRVEAYSPFPIEGLGEALGHPPSRLPWIVLTGGAVGGFAGFMFQWISFEHFYTLNIGGRPYFSWPSFVPVTFELTVLFAALSTVVGLFVLCGLPEPYHPVFNHARFAGVTRDRFFLTIEAADPRFERAGTEQFLRGLRPSEVAEVES